MCKANVLPPGTFPVLGARGYTFFSQKAWKTANYVFKESKKHYFVRGFLKPCRPVCVVVKMVTLRPWQFMGDL